MKSLKTRWFGFGVLLATAATPIHAWSGDFPSSVGARVVVAGTEEQVEDELHLTIGSGDIREGTLRAHVGSQSGSPIGGVQLQGVAYGLSNQTIPHTLFAPGARVELEVTEQFAEHDLGFGPSLVYTKDGTTLTALAYLQPLTGRTIRSTGEKYFCAGGGGRMDAQIRRLSLTGDIESSDCVERTLGNPSHARWLSAEIRGGVQLSGRPSEWKVGVYGGYEKRTLDRYHGGVESEQLVSVSLSVNRGASPSTKAW